MGVRTQPTMRSCGSRGLSEFFEERGEKIRALPFQDAADDRHAMGEALVLRNVIKRAGRTGLFVARSENKTRDPGEKDRSHAHDAGFERHIHRRVGQPPTSFLRGGLLDRQELGMRGGILRALPQIVGADDHLIILHDDRPDGDLRLRGGGAGLLDGRAHEIFVERHVGIIAAVARETTCGGGPVEGSTSSANPCGVDTWVFYIVY